MAVSAELMKTQLMHGNPYIVRAHLKYVHIKHIT